MTSGANNWTGGVREYKVQKPVNIYRIPVSFHIWYTALFITGNMESAIPVTYLAHPCEAARLDRGHGLPFPSILLYWRFEILLHASPFLAWVGGYSQTSSEGRPLPRPPPPPPRVWAGGLALFREISHVSLPRV